MNAVQRQQSGQREATVDKSTMRALVFHGPEEVALETRDRPRVEHDDDVVVKVAATGICGTDRGILAGHVPARQGIVLGHEAIGFVAAVGTGVEDLKTGTAVIVNPTFWCGKCDKCRRGDLGLCRLKTGHEVGVDRDGSLADYIVISRRFVEPIPSRLSFRDAMLVEPIACVLNNAQATKLRPDDDVFVIGGGPIGALWALLARRRAARVAVLEASPYRIERLRALGIDASSGDGGRVEELARRCFNGHLPRVVVETTGALLHDALACVDTGGKIVAMGFDARTQVTVRPFDVTTRGMTIIGAADYNAALFPAAVRVAESLEPGRLITHTLPLERYDDAFERLSIARDGRRGTGYGAMKVVIELVLGVLDANPEGRNHA